MCTQNLNSLLSKQILSQIRIRKRALTTNTFIDKYFSSNEKHFNNSNLNLYTENNASADSRRSFSLSNEVKLNADHHNASKQRKFSTEQWLYKQDRENINKYRNYDLNSAPTNVTFLTEINSDDFENWKLTINEAISNSLLMFFAGYETTSSALAFCCHVIAKLPQERNKLIEEIRENWLVKIWLYIFEN